MANQTVNARVINKHDTSARWNAATSFIPKLGEIISYTDLNRFKIGDGVTTVVNLPFATGVIEDTTNVLMGDGTGNAVGVEAETVTLMDIPTGIMKGTAGGNIVAAEADVDYATPDFVTRAVAAGGGGGGQGGTTDYSLLSNKPSINDVTLFGNKTGADLGLYTLPEGGIPASDLSDEVFEEISSALEVYSIDWRTGTPGQVLTRVEEFNEETGAQISFAKWQDAPSGGGLININEDGDMTDADLWNLPTGIYNVANGIDILDKYVDGIILVNHSENSSISHIFSYKSYCIFNKVGNDRYVVQLISQTNIGDYIQDGPTEGISADDIATVDEMIQYFSLEVPDYTEEEF